MMLYWAGMYLCVGKADVPPAALSAHTYLAAISRLLRPVERGGNAQLTWDDAIYTDHGMRLGPLTFDEAGNRILLEATIKERENMRRYNWLVREVKADLAAAWDQIGRWPLNRQVGRKIPEIQFADNTEIIKMLLGLRHIAAHEDVTLDQLVPAREVTYGNWYHDRLSTVTLEIAARELSVSFQALLTSFSLGWHLNVIADEFRLYDGHLQKLTDILKGTTFNEVLALVLALGAKFVAGPLAIVVDLVTAGGVLEFYTYAQGK